MSTAHLLSSASTIVITSYSIHYTKLYDLTRENVELNFPDDKRHEAFVADGFEYLKDIQDKYDLIILDPPAFAKHRNALSYNFV